MSCHNQCSQGISSKVVVKTPSKMDVAPWNVHWIRMVLDGITWYLMVFDGNRWYCMVLNLLYGIQWYWMILDVIALYSMVFDGIA